jgi:3,4-dihydroxy 2-butanone 4-phosphate synthase
MALSSASLVATSVESAIMALVEGRPLLVYDAEDREGEVDLVYRAELMTEARVYEMRREAGGLICAAIPHELARRTGLPYFSELLEAAKGRYPMAAALAEHPCYDRRSAFGITINHRATFTGVPDRDRSMTLRALGRWAARSVDTTTDLDLAREFAREFSAPGHVPLLYAARGLLDERRGHTELSIALARMASVAPATTVCEMLSEDHRALPIAEARHYARAHDGVFIEGREIAAAWSRWSE